MLEVGNVVSVRGSETLMSVAAIDESSGTVRVIYVGDGGIVAATVPASCLESEEHAMARKLQSRLSLESHRHQNRIDEIELARSAMMQLLSCLHGHSEVATESDPIVPDSDSVSADAVLSLPSGGVARRPKVPPSPVPPPVDDVLSAEVKTVFR